VIELAAVEGLSAADIVHRRMSTLPATCTVDDLRAYFAESSSRQLALLVDGDRYIGCVEAANLPAQADGSAPAADFAASGPVIPASRSAREARDAALAAPSARLPVVDEGGALVGVVAINDRHDGFCGT
jgi:CBS-domain-containing membrane protein